jgi:hypothetical protein
MGKAVKISIQHEQLVTPRQNGRSDARIEELHRLALSEDCGGGVHCPLQLSAVCFSEPAAPQQPEQLAPAGASLALDFRDGLAMALNLDGFPAVGNPI